MHLPQSSSDGGGIRHAVVEGDVGVDGVGGLLGGDGSDACRGLAG